LEDAKRRITDPHFREKQREEVVILETAESAKYTGILIIAVVVIIVVLLGLFIWKGSSLLQNKEPAAPTQDLNDYTPKEAPPAPPVHKTHP